MYNQTADPLYIWNYSSAKNRSFAASEAISLLSDENISSMYFLFADEHTALLTLTEVCVDVGVLNNTKDIRFGGGKSLNENMHKSAQLARNI